MNKRQGDIVLEVGGEHIVYRTSLRTEAIERDLVRTTRVYIGDTVAGLVIENRYRRSLRLVSRCGGEACLSIEIVSREGPLGRRDLGRLEEIYNDRFGVVLPKNSICYDENWVGPYRVVERPVDTVFLGVDRVSVSPGISDRAFCDHSILVYERGSGEVSIDEDFFKRLYRGFFEDGLIWALVRSGAVDRGALPPYIMEGQAYYWPRGDVLRRSLYRWLSSGDPVSMHIYTELIDQILSQLTPSGGLRIPYITAARRENIFGAPQQLYVFEALQRAHRIFGLGGLRERALDALRCFVTQPPECLGYYETGRGGIWFRWGSYHYLSRDPEGREDLFVVNTHLMGVVGMFEGWRYAGCEWCRHYGEEGLRGLRNMIGVLQRGDGYIFYSLFNRERIGEREDVLVPHAVGYHTLSSRLILRASSLSGDSSLVESGVRGCLYSLEMFRRGRRDLREELLRCLVEMYRNKRREALDMIDSVATGPGRPLAIIGYSLDEVREDVIPPRMALSGEVSVVLLDTREDSLEYYVYMSRGSRIEVRDTVLPSGLEVSIGSLGLRSLGEGERHRVYRGPGVYEIYAEDTVRGVLEIELYSKNSRRE